MQQAMQRRRVGNDLRPGSPPNYSDAARQGSLPITTMLKSHGLMAIDVSLGYVGSRQLASTAFDRNCNASNQPISQPGKLVAQQVSTDKQKSRQPSERAIMERDPMRGAG